MDIETTYKQAIDHRAAAHEHFLALERNAPTDPSGIVQLQLAKIEWDAAQYRAEGLRSLCQLDRIANLDHPTAADLAKAFGIYVENLDEIHADLFEAMVKKFAVDRGGEYLPKLASILAEVRNLRQYHGTGMCSWDTVSDIHAMVDGLQ